MSDLIIGEPLASRIRQLAEHAKIDIETLLKRMIERYQNQMLYEEIAAELDNAQGNIGDIPQ